MGVYTGKIGKKVVNVTFGITSLHSNCGARVLHGVQAYYDSNTVYAAQTKGVPNCYPSLKEIYEVLDNNWPAIRVEVSMSTYVISDRVNAPNPSNVGNVNDTTQAFRTVDFINYLINRKRGNIYAGPVTTNANYPNTSAICTWTWIPRPESHLIDDNRAHFSTDVKPDKKDVTFASLTAFVKDYLTTVPAFANQML